MDVERTHHVDASEDSDPHPYYYAYDVYSFREAGSCFLVRAYVDTPDRASFLSVVPPSGRGRHLRRADLRDPLFASACEYLRGRGMNALFWLTEKGYAPVP